MKNKKSPSEGWGSLVRKSDCGSGLPRDLAEVLLEERVAADPPTSVQKRPKATSPARRRTKAVAELDAAARRIEASMHEQEAQLARLRADLEETTAKIAVLERIHGKNELILRVIHAARLVVSGTARVVATPDEGAL